MRPIPKKFLGAMIALRALPGSPRYAGSRQAVLDSALSDLAHYVAAGLETVILENSHDLPYIKPPLPVEAVDTVRSIALEIRRQFKGVIGLQLLEAANETALEIASQTDLDFLRVEGYVFAHIGGAGLIEGCAGRLLRKRKELGCEQVRIFADVKKKHCSHALTADLDITDEVKQSEFFLADGIVVTGARTAEPPDLSELRRVQQAAHLPVVIGSGMTPDNIADFYSVADGFIIGSTFRKQGRFLGDLDPERLENFTSAFRKLGSD